MCKLDFEHKSFIISKTQLISPKAKVDLLKGPLLF